MGSYYLQFGQRLKRYESTILDRPDCIATQIPTTNYEVYGYNARDILQQRKPNVDIFCHTCKASISHEWKNIGWEVTNIKPRQLNLWSVPSRHNSIGPWRPQKQTQ